MKFDVVIGNPPYNNDIYLDFVTLGDKLSKQLTCMITPAKWQAKSGGNNEQFRIDLMPRMKEVRYYPDTFEIFDIREQEGISIFLIDKYIHNDKSISVLCKANSNLNSSGVRGDIGLTLYGGVVNSIIKKFNTGKMLDSLINNKPNTFVDLTFRGNKTGELPVYSGDEITGYIDRNSLLSTTGLEQYKVITSRMPVDVGFDKNGKVYGLSKTYILKPYEVPKGSFIVLMTFDTEEEALSFQSYCNTLPVRLLYFVGLCGKAMSNRFWRLIPVPDALDHIFTNEELYSKYNLTQDEVRVIASIIKERN